MLSFSMKSLEGDITDVIKSTLLEYAQKIYTDAMAGLSGWDSVKATYRFEVTNNGMMVSIWTDEDMAAYIEFGTGNFAKSYLSGKPAEMVAEALQFFKTGKGTLPTDAYLFPAFYKYKEEIPKVIDDRIQKLLNKL